MSEQEDKKSFIPTISPESEILAVHLRKLKQAPAKLEDMCCSEDFTLDKLEQGQLDFAYPYKKLSDVIGKNVQKEGRGFLDTARKKVRAEDGISVAVIRGRGVYFPGDADLVKIARGYIPAIRRKAEKGKKLIVRVDYHKLSEKEKYDAITASTMLHYIGNASKQSQYKKIGQAVASEDTRTKLGDVFRESAKQQAKDSYELLEKQKNEK